LPNLAGPFPLLNGYSPMKMLPGFPANLLYFCLSARQKQLVLSGLLSTTCQTLAITEQPNAWLASIKQEHKYLGQHTTITSWTSSLSYSFGATEFALEDTIISSGSSTEHEEIQFSVKHDAWQRDHSRFTLEHELTRKFKHDMKAASISLSYDYSLHQSYVFAVEMNLDYYQPQGFHLYKGQITPLIEYRFSKPHHEFNLEVATTITMFDRNGGEKKTIKPITMEPSVGYIFRIDSDNHMGFEFNVAYYFEDESVTKNFAITFEKALSL